jgi:hypothetical protein
MAKLPPIRKRQSYSDVKPGDLVYALFADRISPPDPIDTPAPAPRPAPAKAKPRRAEKRVSR